MRPSSSDMAFANSTISTQLGLTKREYFAAAAITCIVQHNYSAEDVAHAAVRIADALIEELKR